MGKHRVWVALMITASFLTCGACTRHEFASCSDEKVEKIVLEKTNEITRDLYVGRTAPAALGLHQAKGSYDFLKKKLEKKDEPRRKEIGKVLAAADHFLTTITVKLTDVKHTDTIKKTGTNMCSGSLMYTNLVTKKTATAAIQYKTRYTDDHKLDVEMTRF